MKRHDVKINIPDNLKALLVDDWENVTKNQQLVPLPRDLNVNQLLQKYRESVPKKREGSADADIFDEVIAGLKLYFDRSLGTILLYRFERQQYLEIRKEHPGKEPSDIYGAEHLLRLFGKLPLARENCLVQKGMVNFEFWGFFANRVLANSLDAGTARAHKHGPPIYLEAP